MYEIISSKIGDEDVLRNVVLSDIEKLKQTLATVSTSDFEHAVDLITSAENVYIIGSSNSSDIISETFPCSLKRKGIITIYCNASSNYTSSERKVYVDIKINGSIVDTLTVTVPKNYLSFNGFKNISVNIGDVIDYDVRTSGSIEYDISLRGKIELKGGIIE